MAAAFLAYLTTADLGRHAERIVAVLSNLLGRQLEVAKLHLELDLDLTATVSATGVSLTSPAGTGDGELLSIDRLDGEVELWPLFQRSIVVRDLAVEGLRLAVVVDEHGASNWARTRPGHGREDRAADGRTRVLELVVGRAVLAGVTIVVATPALQDPLEISATSLELATRPDGMAVVAFDGAVAHRELSLRGEVGPVSELLAAGDVRGDLRLASGRARATLRGAVGDLGSLGRPDLRIEIAAPDLEDLAPWLRPARPPAGLGPLAVRCSLEHSRSAVRIAAESSLGELTARVGGELDALAPMRRCDLDVRVAGPDLAAAGAAAGVAHLPAGPFAASGRVTWAGFPVELRGVELRVGPDRLAIDGTCGAPPQLHGTDLALSAEGPDARALGAALGIGLPAVPYRVAGRVRRLDGGFELAPLEVALASDRLTVSGRVGVPPGFRGTDLTLAAHGASLAPYRELGWSRLPDDPFEAAARVSIDAGFVGVDQGRIAVGDARAEVDGRIATGAGLAGTAVEIAASGGDLSRLGWLTPGSELPAGPFHVAGGLAVEDGAVVLHEAHGGVAGASVAADGRVGLADDLEGTALQVSASGPDASLPLSLVGIEGGRDLPFRLSGATRVAGSIVTLERAAAAVGDLHATAAGHLALVDPLSDLELDVEVAGARASELVLAGAPAGLPAVPFRAAGHVRAEDGCVQLRRVAATLADGHRLELDGWVAAAPGLVGTDLRVALAGPDLGALGRSWPTVADLPELPGAPYHLTAGVAVDGDGIDVRELVADLGRARVELAGHVGGWPGLEGTDLVVRAGAPDLTELGGLLGDVRLPALPLTLAGRLSWAARSLRVDGLDLRLGGSDAAGSVLLAAGERPALDVRLESRTVDLDELRGPPAEQPTADPAAALPDRRVFSDEPFHLQLLRAVDGDVVWDVGELCVASATAANLELTARLDHGRLVLGPITVRGARGGSIGAVLSLEPRAGSIGLETALSVERARADLTLGAVQDVDRLTTVDAVVDLRAGGATPHELAASTSGHVTLSLVGGDVRSTIIDRLGAGLIRAILGTLNPFRGAAAETVELECAVLVADLTEGRLVLDPMVVKTSTLTIIGHGAVDLATESLDLEWVTKPRKGIGLSASTITNPYVKLSGTLANPSIGMKKAEALATTGAAVATGGLSLLGKGLYDRLTADSDVCAKALAEARPPAQRAP